MTLNGPVASAVAVAALILIVIGAAAISEDRSPAARSPTTVPAPAGRAAGIDYVRGRKIATLANTRINESSGLACSRRYENVFWTHNDSGGGPRLYAFGSDGRDLGTFVVTGASAKDWEDMASFSISGKSFLIVGDVGDNASRRRFCTLYIIPEPAIDLRLGRGVRPLGRVRPVRKLDYVYKDGPVDCESVGVDTTSGTIILLAKRPRRTIYTLPLDGLKGVGRSRPLVAKPVGVLQLGWTTAMDISPDALRAVVLTYGDAYEYVRQPDETWSRALSQTPRRIALPRRRQGESICYGRDGKTLYLTSEKLPTPLLEIPERNSSRAIRAGGDRNRNAGGG